MAQVKTVSGKKETWKEKCARTAREVVKRRWLFFLLIPGILDPDNGMITNLIQTITGQRNAEMDGGPLQPGYRYHRTAGLVGCNIQNFPSDGR